MTKYAHNKKNKKKLSAFIIKPVIYMAGVPSFQVQMVFSARTITTPNRCTSAKPNRGT